MLAIKMHLQKKANTKILTWIRFKGDIQVSIRKKLPKHVYEINQAHINQTDDTCG